MSAIVCVPVYQQNPDATAAASLLQTIRVLASTPVVIAHPKSLDIGAYKSLISSLRKDLSFLAFPDQYFVSTKSYSRLLTSLDFYTCFSAFDYLLVCQLDAWVFRDDLEYWCRQGFAYVGAPCWQGDNVWVGNGGFSLRHIPSFIQILQSKELDQNAPLSLPVFRDSWCNLNWKGKLFKLFRYFGICNSIRFHMGSGLLNEDAVWGLLAPLLSSNFSIPDWTLAARFSFEAHPSTLYAQTQGQLPFGCHAWQKHEPIFWSRHISLATPTTFLTKLAESDQ